MLKNEFMARLTVIGESQSSFAKRVNVTRECVNRWVNQTEVPVLAVMALELMEIQFYEKPVDADSYRVKWVCDVPADSAEEAAKMAREYQDATATVYDCTDINGNVERIDL